MTTASAPPRSGRIDQLAIAEYLRAEHRLKGRVTEFSSDEWESMVVFKAPGYAADCFIDHQTLDYSLTISTSALIAVMNDLHKGRDSGPQWSLLIDVVSILLILMSLSGFGLLFYLKKRRLSGVNVAVLGTIGLLVVWVLWVP